MPGQARRLSVAFSVRGETGVVDVEINPNDDPTDVGCDLLLFGMPAATATGYPACTATVTYPRIGYGAVFGWTQLVCSTDNTSAGALFEMDPIAVYRDVDTPFAWYGVKPTLFDAPYRFDRQDMVWECHSFLACLPDAVMTRRVQAVAGFSWGFEIGDGAITFLEPSRLDGHAWDNHLPILRLAHPGWQFDAGLRDT